MQGPKFEMKSVALSFAIVLCVLCHEVLLVHVHQLVANDISLEKRVTGKVPLGGIC